MKKLHFVVGALVLCGEIYTVKAEPHSVDNDNLETITVLGKAATDDAELGGTNLKELPINTHVVGREELERLRFVDPNEFLDRIPGETQVRNLRIPDGGKGYTVPMLDGIPLENPYEGATQRLDRTNTFDMDRVEIIKGPASALFPNNAFGGVVNVVSRNAPLQSERQVSIEAGDFNRLRAGVSAGGTLGDIGYFFDANTRNLNGLRDEYKNDRDQVSSKLLFHPSDQTRIAVRAEYLDEQKVERGDLTAEQIAENPSQAGSLSSSTDLQQSMVSMKLSQLLEYGKIDAHLLRREKDTVGASRFRGPQDENDTAYNAKIMYRHDLVSSNVILGYDGYFGTQKGQQYGRGDLALQGPFSTFKNTLDIHAYFAQYQMNATNDLVLTTGARYENIELADVAKFSDLAIKLGATYQLTSKHMIWAGFSEGFYAPDAVDLFDPETGNPELKPEEAENIEIGFRGSWASWQYDTSFYHNDISNYLVTQELVRENGDEYEQTTNAGKVALKGIETVIEYAPENTNWRAGITHTFARNQYDSFVQSTPGASDDLSGKVLRRSPEHHLNARIAWLPTAGLVVELEGDFYSPYFADNANSHESKFKRDSRVNLRVSYQTGAWRLWAHGLNLTDTLEDRATYSRRTMKFRTVDGRTFYAGTSYTF